MFSHPTSTQAPPCQTLTPQQFDQLPQHLKKWQNLAHSTQRIDRDRATRAINALYLTLGYPSPELRFCQSPAEIPTQQNHCLQDKLDLFGILPSLESVLGRSLCPEIEALRDRFDQSIQDQLSWTVQMDLEEELRYHLRYPLYTCQLLEHLLQTEPALHHPLHESISLDTWVEDTCCQDFCIERLGCRSDAALWPLLKNLVQSCSWIVPYEQVCFVCDRPHRLQINGQGQLHGEGIPAVLFGDGLAVYAHGDVRLPEHYGKVHPHQWRSQWIFEEPNPMLQRVLIEGIGYGRLCQELPVQIVDRWREYSLMRVVSGSGAVLVLLKLACIKTGMTHVVRVPPRLRSARAAARWANWGEEPEVFAIAS